MGYLKPRRPLSEQDLHTSIFRIQSHRELLFEEVSVKRFRFPLFTKMKTIANPNPHIVISLNISMKLNRIKNLSYVLLRRAEPVNNRSWYTGSSLFPLKYNDLITTQTNDQICIEKSPLRQNNKSKTNYCLALTQRLFFPNFYNYLFIETYYDSLSQ